MRGCPPRLLPTHTLRNSNPILSTYYNRSELNSEYLERYNDVFPKANEVSHRLEATFSFVEECNFPADSRAWKKTDLFTLLVEIDAALHSQGRTLDAARIGTRLQQFYLEVNALFALTRVSETDLTKYDAPVFRYLNAATKATNDRYARVDRADVISTLILQDGVEPAARSRKLATLKR